VAEELEHPEKDAAALAEFLLALRAQETAGGPAARPEHFERGVPLSTRDEQTRSAIASLDGLLDSAALLHAWERALEAAAHTGPPVWVHGDLRPGNLLSREGRLNAVIDFGCLAVGDPACDLQVAWNFFSGRARAAFREALRADEPAWERGRGWALSVSAIALPYYQHTNRVMADIARRTIGQVLG
jgi:aminoglycoside phosphotransferase (APT) family kinase protein